MSVYTGIRGKGLLFLLLLWFLWFLNFVGRLTFSPFLPLIEDEFVVTHAQASSLFFTASVGNAISLFLSGIFTGFLGYKKSILCFLSLSAITFFLVPQVKQFSQLRALLFCLGFSSGIYLPSALAMLTHHFPPKTWGKALAIHDTGASLSVFAAPLIAVFLLQFLLWRNTFYVFAFTYALCACVFFFTAKELKTDRAFKGFMGSVYRRKSLWYLAIVWSFAAGGFLALYYITPLYLTKELGFGIEYANKIFGLSRLGGSVLVILIGFLIDRFSLKKSMFAILLASGLFTILLSFPNKTLVQVALFLEGTIIIGFFPLGLVAISKMFINEERSLAAGTTSTIAALFGAGLLPYLFGLAGDHLTFGFGILVFGILLTLSSGLVFFIDEIG